MLVVQDIPDGNERLIGFNNVSLALRTLFNEGILTEDDMHEYMRIYLEEEKIKYQ